MKVAIHQPHFLPWMGYFDKMAKADVYVLLDDVQLEDRSPMLRNKMLTRNGEIQYLTVHVNKKGYRTKLCREITLAYGEKWNEKVLKFLEMNYKHARFFPEVFPDICQLLTTQQLYLIDIQSAITSLMIKWLEIKTPIILQSTINYDVSKKKSELMLELTRTVGGDCYLSGQGAKKYMDDQQFEEQGIHVEYQSFTQPEYKPYNARQFIPQLSLLDMFLSCGIEETKRVFWENVKLANDIKHE